ncbi:hypothetical protein RB620_10140 [Paenibacillus sp. LHD-117]|uniref:CdiA C-terminal domain-containing protein n=1 Tax=Paenibacillus sp. LHD-117 TaxID=3071412 RepID=UPI0027DEF403|nr:hypothetical protein [Paenibacillus sp. LHD-117]MDQ6419790.1 hypothetical protein [Paenibacillus sp. LHD-117]
MTVLKNYKPLATYSPAISKTISTAASQQSSSASTAKASTPQRAPIAATSTPAPAQKPSVQTTVPKPQAQSTVGTIYTANKSIINQPTQAGTKVNVSANTFTPSSKVGGTAASASQKSNPASNTQSTAKPPTPNEQILKAKQDYETAQKAGDKSAMATASKLAEEARKNGGTISSNVTLSDTKVMVANEQILKAKQDYEIAQKAGNSAGMRTATAAADAARASGGTISSQVTLDQAKTIVANEQIYIAKTDYAAAQKASDSAGMKAAERLAEQARKNGGTISADVTLEETKQALGQLGKLPMDHISASDEASLIAKAKENEKKFGVNTQLNQIDKAIDELNKSIGITGTTLNELKDKVKDLKKLREEYQDGILVLEEAGLRIDQLQEQTEEMMKEIDKLMASMGISKESAAQFKQQYREVSGLAEGKRGTLLQEAMYGFFSGMYHSAVETAEFALFAFENRTEAGKQVINGVSGTIQGIWDAVSDPKATYKEAQAAYDDFMELSKEDKARAFGLFLFEISPSGRTKLFVPDKGGGNGSSGGVSGIGEGVGFNPTAPSLPKGGKPKGEYAQENARGYIKQNESADLFANEGYDIEMIDELPNGNGYGIEPQSNPDFIIEGNVFDHYAPLSTKSANGIATEIAKKTKTQAERIVLNLDDFTAEQVKEVTEKILGKANPNGDLKHLQELFVVRDGEINLLYRRK